MACNVMLPEEDLSCPVCCDIFTDPVLLSCSHSFCKTCLLKCWKEKEKNCPVCRRRSSKHEPPVSLALKNVCDAFLKQKGQGALECSEVFCIQHGEKLKLFCLDDQLPICVVCQTSKKHKNHNCCPIDEAAKDYKEKLQKSLRYFQAKQKTFVKVKQACDQMSKHIKVQVHDTEIHIKEQFKMLHQFLQEEEEARIAALRKEEEQKSMMMKEKTRGIHKDILTLLDTVQTIKKALASEDLSFLQNYKTTVNRAQCTLPDPQLVSGALIDVAKHLGNLSFRVWEKMKERVRFTPVILDPNTAHPCLSLSDDLTSVRNTYTEQQLPDNPERNTFCATVVGSEGFSSGLHSWEVEVGDHPDWNIGVVKESADRRGNVVALPHYGVWTLEKQRSGKHFNVVGQRIIVKRILKRIGIQLDYDGGGLLFYNPEDMTVISSHTDNFSEKLYPYFSIGKAGDDQLPDINMCHSKVWLKINFH